jgi:hypothetical protein
MVRPVQEIEAQKTDRGIRMSHPAFGQLGASRVSGRRTLYGSDFEHNSYITIRISESELNRDLSRDWPMAKKGIIEVSVSEAQWATFVSAMNVGEGVPCTIEYRDSTGYVPSFPIPDRTEQFKAEFGERLGRSVEKLQGLLSQINEMGIKVSQKNALSGTVANVIMELNQNLPYVASSFEEHIEETVDKMKSEVHGYIAGVLQRTGIEALQGQQPLQIEAKND